MDLTENAQASERNTNEMTKCFELKLYGITIMVIMRTEIFVVAEIFLHSHIC